MRIKKSGFTLIELLVVIAIIALLLSIIMPSYGKIKLIVKEVLCKNNMKQYALATELLTNDNDDMLPNPWASLYSQSDEYTSDGETQRYCRWHDRRFSLGSYPKYAGRYWEYLADVKVNVCPTFASYKRFGNLHPNHEEETPVDGPFFSYSMNGSLKRQGSGTGDAAKPIRKTVVTNTASTFLWGEENWYILNEYSDTTLNDNSLLIESSITDSFGTFHGASAAQIEAEMPEDNASKGEYKRTGFTFVLLMDGSLEKVTPDDNFIYCGKQGGY